MTGGRRPGGQVSAADAVAQAGAALTPPYQVAGPDGEDARGLRLRDPAGRLPELTLRLQREQRLFSRTFPLWVFANAEGDGPAAPGAFEYRRPRLLQKPSLRWVGKPGADHRSWVERFERAGLVEGAATMTNIQHLAVLWKAERRTWLLQLSTLAGALIGVGPANSYAIPLEPADVEGLLRIVAAFGSATTGI